VPSSSPPVRQRPSTSATPPLSADQLLAASTPLGGMEPPLWTPEGDAVVAASPLGGTTDLWAFPLDGGPPSRLTAGMGAVGHLASALPRWSPDGSYLSYVSGDIGDTEVWLQPADGAPAFRLSDLGANITSLGWSPDGASLIVAANRYGAYDLFEVSVPDGTPTRLTDDARYEVQPTVTPDGRYVVYVRLDETWTEHDVMVLPLDASRDGGSGTDGGGDPEPRLLVHDERFFDYQYGRWFGTPVVSPDGATVVFRSYRSDWLNLWAVRFAGGDPRPIAPDAADQDHACFSPDGAWIAYSSNQDASVQLRLVPAGGGEPRVLVDPGDGVCAFPTFSPDGRHLAFTLSTPTHPADLHVVEVATGEVRRLTRSVAANIEARLVRPERVTYAGDDGLEIPSYLYRPESAGVAPNGAGVVVVHGGPTMQWFPAFDAYAQFLALRGYTLLLPNIRGSSGYGRAFEEANDRDWLGGDLQDVVRGGRYLHTVPGVDEERVAVTGLSYGGVMSMGVAVDTVGEFGAAASLSGYGDFLRVREEHEVRHQRFMAKELGDPVADRDIYLRASPIHRVKQATVPLLIAHGVGRWPDADAGRQFADALRREYKTVRYVTYPDEHYYVTGRENLRALWYEVDDFFRHYLDLPR
jgi:dipeptidyl aminopeptidase/acylaminoacyl peptidase